VACSDGLVPDPASGRCPDNGARVNLADCSITAGVGAAELKALWRDPDFDPAREAFYYLRVLENPTCRWSTWDAIRAGVAPRSDLHSTIQERAWSSPIWYRPQAASPGVEAVQAVSGMAGTPVEGSSQGGDAQALAGVDVVRVFQHGLVSLEYHRVLAGCTVMLLGNLAEGVALLHRVKG